MVAEEKKKKYLVKDGPSMFEGIICRYWFFPQENTTSALMFKLKKEGPFWVHLFGVFPITHHGQDPDEVLLFGSACNTATIGGKYFVMHYNKRLRTGTVEPIDQLTCENEMLIAHFPGLFKKPEPTPESPVLVHLRGIQWEEKVKLAKSFFLETLCRGDTNLCCEHVLRLLEQARPNVTAGIEMTAHPLGSVFFRVLNELCPKMNSFFSELDMGCYLVCGADLIGHEIKRVKLALGPNHKLEVE
ncbi:hypothetical protein A2482_01835 [Candidatus Falkowbacteria bacterium RIFOXYC2_FULL_48_21]|uniref:Uncharacterized protein n=1 Tax=Candidatus Falkowbacteria bacterium RIFOXYC2_FULL_48_21 TaxID=1798005 RepID=A0A1F5TG36_9BACT|nr:MAG: hypothetical protein A2482_01835 [Candidatus Falkowbacteria bacterium RIFOXYC2_FULL_48_21]